MDSKSEREYIKSRFRCPICGKLVGYSEKNEIILCEEGVFQRHVSNCRHTHRVKDNGTESKRNAD